MRVLHNQGLLLPRRSPLQFCVPSSPVQCKNVRGPRGRAAEPKSLAHLILLRLSPFLKSRAVRIGLVLLVLGIGPLLGVTLVEWLGVFPELRPNPRYLSTFAWLTVWPSGTLIALGAWRARGGSDERPER